MLHNVLFPSVSLLIKLANHYTCSFIELLACHMYIYVYTQFKDSGE